MSEDISMDQSNDSLGASNPGTPRSEVRATPPPNSAAFTNAQITSVHDQDSRQTHSPISKSDIPTSLTVKQQPTNQQSQSKYAQLLNVIEDMGRDIRPTYAGNRPSAERLKRGIVHARILVRECLMECERAART